MVVSLTIRLKKIDINKLLLLLRRHLLSISSTFINSNRMKAHIAHTHTQQNNFLGRAHHGNIVIFVIKFGEMGHQARHEQIRRGQTFI